MARAKNERSDYENCPFCGEGLVRVPHQNGFRWMCRNYGWGCKYSRDIKPDSFVPDLGVTRPNLGTPITEVRLGKPSL